MTKKSQNQIIIWHLAKHRTERFIASDFMKDWSDYFVWYSAGCRLSTLLKLWLVFSRTSEKKTEKGVHFMEYMISEKGMEAVEKWKTRFPSPHKKKKKNTKTEFWNLVVFEIMRFQGVVWIVKAFDLVTEELKVFIWRGGWENEREDITHIIKEGSKLEGEQIKNLCLFIEDTSKLGNIEELKEKKRNRKKEFTEKELVIEKIKRLRNDKEKIWIVLGWEYNEELASEQYSAREESKKRIILDLSKAFECDAIQAGVMFEEISTNLLNDKKEQCQSGND